jgi:DNA-binding MarR family transcriptional regulator
MAAIRVRAKFRRIVCSKNILAKSSSHKAKMASASARASSKESSELIHHLGTTGSRTVRHLDRLVKAGGDDKELGKRALRRLGFVADD